MELTILMPCLNEEKTIGRCIKKAQSFIEKNNINGEVLIADNGSTDKSIIIAEELGARVIKVERKRLWECFKKRNFKSKRKICNYGRCRRQL